MKALVFILVLANVLFYAFTEGYLGRPEHPDGGRLEQQVQPERMKIVSRGEVPTAPAIPSAEAPPVAPSAAPPAAPPVSPAASEAAASPPSSAPSDAPAEAARQVTAPAPPVDGKPAPAAPVATQKTALEPTACLHWENLSVADAERIRGVLAGKFPQFNLLRQEGEGSGWWVYIPPLIGKAEADKKAAELRGFGVTDYFIIPDGPNRFAISLGIFSAEKGGQERLAELKEKGVRSARLTPRPGKDGTVSLEASGPLANQEALLKAVGKPQAKLLDAACK